MVFCLMTHFPSNTTPCAVSGAEEGEGEEEETPPMCSHREQILTSAVQSKAVPTSSDQTSAIRTSTVQFTAFIDFRSLSVFTSLTSTQMNTVVFMGLFMPP